MKTDQPFEECFAPEWANPDENDFSAEIEDDPFAEEEVLTGELLPAESTALLSNEEAGSIVDMDKDEALATHNQIKQGRELTKFLLLKMRDRKGWKTGFGYKSWEEYLSHEFDAEDERTFRRWVAHARVQLRLAGKKSGHNVRNEKELALLPQISQAQALVLAKLPEELQASVYEDAKKAAEPMTYRGKASIYNGRLTTKFLTDFVDAKLETMQKRLEAQKPIPADDVEEMDIFALTDVNTPEMAAEDEAEAFPVPVVAPPKSQALNDMEMRVMFGKPPEAYVPSNSFPQVSESELDESTTDNKTISGVTTVREGDTPVLLIWDNVKCAYIFQIGSVQLHHPMRQIAEMEKADPDADFLTLGKYSLEELLKQ